MNSLKSEVNFLFIKIIKMQFIKIKTLLFFSFFAFTFTSFAQIGPPRLTNFDDLDSVNNILKNDDSISLDEVADVVDSLKIEESEIPSKDIYHNWNNKDIRTGNTSSKFIKDTVLVLVADSHQFVFPYKGKICSTFGPRGRRNHAGLDIKLSKGDPVVAAFDGVVRMAKNYSGYGKLVVIRHYNGLETVYGHLSKISVKINQKVKAGDLVGLGGRTGRATTEHLHFETRYLGVAFHPLHVLNFDNYQLAYDTLYVNRHTFKMTKVPVRKKPNSPDFDDDIKPIDSIPPTPQFAIDSSLTDSLKTPLTFDNKIVPKQNEKKTIKNSNFHIIHQGDTLYKISRKYDIPVAKICEINKIKPTDVLSIGQKIHLN